MRLTPITPVLAGVLLMGSAPAAALAETQYDSTPYYEAEPWYDVTEWFDDDDYRLTEAGESLYGEQDGDNTYDYDYDTSYTYTPYGYNDRYAADDWFYDYWDDGYAYYRDFDNDGLYEYSATYYDFDSDGLYDGYTSVYDWDGDGWYEDYNYYTFNSQGESFDSQNQQPSQSKQRTVKGDVASVKKIAVRDTQHTIVKLKSSQDGVSMIDLGPVSKLSGFDIAKGVLVKARGPVAKVGEKQLLVAQTGAIDGESFEVDRNNRQLTGEVQKTRTVDSRDGERLLVAIKRESGEKKALIDLGPSDALDIELQEGDTVQVDGTPVAMKDRRVLLAHTLTHDGETITIDRSQKSDMSSQASKRGSNSTTGQQANSQRQGERRATTVKGRIAEKKSAQVCGQERCVCVLKLSDNNKMLCDFGPAKEAPQSCSQGDQVAVSGVIVRARDGQPVMLARFVKKGGERSRIRGNASSADLGGVTGDVKSMRTLEVRGEERQLAAIQTDEGKQMLIDLGPAEQLSLDLSQGDSLSAKGRFVKANDQVILVAYEASTDDSGAKTIRLYPSRN